MAAFAGAGEVDDAENNLVFKSNWACTSSPIRGRYPLEELEVEANVDFKDERNCESREID